jgi:hypothetical protein
MQSDSFFFFAGKFFYKLKLSLHILSIFSGIFITFMYNLNTIKFLQK